MFKITSASTTKRVKSKIQSSMWEALNSTPSTEKREEEPQQSGQGGIGMAVTLLEMEHKEQKGVRSLRLVYAPRA